MRGIVHWGLGGRGWSRGATLGSVGAAVGTRGFVAGLSWQQLTRTPGPAIRSAFRRRLAAAMEGQSGDLDPAALWGFFELRAPLGNIRGLTCFASL